MQRLRWILLPAITLLAACGEQTPERNADAREAEGEVLGGTISDEMLPLDQLQSQSPTIRESSVVSTDEEGNTSVETTVEVTSGEGAENQPAPPQPPATPEG